MTGRGIAVMGAALTVLTACAGTSSSAPDRAPSPAPALARGDVRVHVVQTCGAGGRRCPAEFSRRLSHDLARHHGLAFATPDTVVYPSVGCGGSVRAPFGPAHVTDTEIRWHADWTGRGPDCFGTVIAFLRFARPVWDLHSPLRFVTTVTNIGRHRHTYRYPAFAAPDLARWAR